MPNGRFDAQLTSLHAISVEIAALRQLSQIYDRALGYGLDLTESVMGFIDLLSDEQIDMDVVAVKGFEPLDPQFFERFRRMPVRPSVFGVVITEGQPHISNDVAHDPLSVGQPPGHPPVRRFLGVPLKVSEKVIGMIGVANKAGGYDAEDARLLSTLANQVAVAIDNARLYTRQREMIDRLARLQQRLGTAERDQLLSLERERISAGLHDEIEQGIFSIGLQLNWLLELDLDPDVDRRIRQVRKLAATTADKVKEVIFALGVEGHIDADLTASVQRLLDELAKPAELDAELVVDGEPGPGLIHVQGPVYAVIKEAVTNVVRHAQARSMLVRINYEKGRLSVMIQDDGIGVSNRVLGGEVEGPHFGIRNMRRYIAALGGEFEAFPGDEAGVTVRFTVPLTEPLQP
jgi:signal transduction histidine kinase